MMWERPRKRLHPHQQKIQGLIETPVWPWLHRGLSMKQESVLDLTGLTEVLNITQTGNRLRKTLYPVTLPSDFTAKRLLLKQRQIRLNRRTQLKMNRVLLHKSPPHIRW